MRTEEVLEHLDIDIAMKEMGHTADLRSLPASRELRARCGESKSS